MNVMGVHACFARVVCARCVQGCASLGDGRADTQGVHKGKPWKYRRAEPQARHPRPGATHPDRGSVGLAGNVPQPADSPRDAVVCRRVAQRPGAAVARDLSIDEARVSLAQRLVVDAMPLDDVGQKVVDEHVAAVDEFL